MELREYNSYNEMIKAHQKDISNFPIIYMFGRKTDDEMKVELSKIGAKCMAECVSVFGCGDVVRRIDVPKLMEILKNQGIERFHFYEDDNKLEDAILSEMNNHEYSYTGNSDDVLSALSLKSMDDRVRKIWKRAEKKCLEGAF